EAQVIAPGDALLWPGLSQLWCASWRSARLAASHPPTEVPMRRIGFAVILALTIVAFVAEAQEKGNAANAAEVYRIGPEDTLFISVWKTLTRTVLVRSDGKISLPLLNDVQVAGLTALELRDVLPAKLGEFIPSPEVVVIVSPGALPPGDLRPGSKRIPFNYNKVTPV